MVIARPLTLVRRGIAGYTTPHVPVDIPLIAAAGVAVIVALLVGWTAIGSGDYGQWLMVSRGFGGLSTPAYRDLSDVPPMVPVAISVLHGWLGDPILALHATGFLIVGGMGAALYAAGLAIDGRSVTGLVAVVLGLLVSDQYLGLLAFGGLLQAAAIVFMTLAVAAFIRAFRSPRTQRRWWAVGCAALFLTCVTHVPTATIALPVCVAAAGISVLPPTRAAVMARLRSAIPLLFGFAVIGAYWAVAVAPASVTYVTNPASLAYRGPDRLVELLIAYPPTVLIIAVGFIALAVWVVRPIVGRHLPPLRDARTILLAWVAASWGAFAVSALGGASTDYPRFGPLLVIPLVVVVAAALTQLASAVGRRSAHRLNADHGLVGVALAIVVLAPFSIANYQTQAQGYRLPDDVSLAAAASWADSRVIPGKTILAPVREAKWVEGLTGRSALFASQVRYAFRPVEWDRSLAAGTLLRGDAGLVNETFNLTLNDGVPSADFEQPRALLIAANHGGEYVDLLRLVPASSLVLAGDGNTLVSLPALAPAGFDRAATSASVATMTTWVGVRAGQTVRYSEGVDLAAGSASFGLHLRATSQLPLGGLRAELKAQSGTAILNVELADQSAIVTFARFGRTEPRLRIDLPNGTITANDSGSLFLATTGSDLSVTVTDLTAGGASASLRLLDPRAVVDDYGVGAVILHRDPAYEDRRDRLELLGFRVAHDDGPYVVMVRAGSGRPATP